MTNKEHFVPMAQTELNKEITSIGKTGNRLNTRIQHAALNAIFYTITQGDIGYGQRLVMALNNGQRKNSLVAFLEKYGKFQWSKEQKSLIFRKRDDLTIESIDEIDEKWWDTIKAPEPKSMYDFEDDVSKFIKRMEKAVVEHATIKHIEVMDYVKAAIDKYHADQIEHDEAEFDDEDLAETAELIAQVVQEEAMHKEVATDLETQPNRQPLAKAA